MFYYLLLGYLIGSIPFAWIMGKLFKGKDMRTIGSLNVGTTNVVKNIGILPGILTAVGDIGKGCLAALLGVLSPFPGLQFILPAIAIAGHNWPLWLRFQGGGGLATFIGSSLMLASWQVLVVAMAIWGVCAWLIRDHDRSAILACIATPVIVFLLTHSEQSLVFIGSSSLVILLRRLQSLGSKQTVSA